MEFCSDIEIGKHLQALREEANLSRADLVKAVGIDRPTLSRIESGERAVTASEVLLLSRFFEIGPERLLRKEASAGEGLLRVSDDSDEVTTRSIAVFAECIEDYFGLEALSR